MRTILGIVVGASMALGACGGSESVVDHFAGTADSESEPDTGLFDDPSALGEDARAAVDALVAVHGTDGAFLAVLNALERGYAAEQVIAAGAGGTLSTDGAVAGVAPEREPAGVVDRGGDEHAAPSPRDAGTAIPVRFVRPQDRSAEGNLERMRRQLREWGRPGDEGVRIVTIMIIDLARNGYSIEQILDAFLLDATSVSRAGLCTALKYPGGGVVAPERPSPTRCKLELEDFAAHAGRDRSVWAGVLRNTSEATDFDGPATVTISRPTGSDRFRIVIDYATSSARAFTPDGFEERICTDRRARRYEGEGTFAEDGSQLLFTGSETVTLTYPDCGDLGIANDGETTTSQRDIHVVITDAGIEGVYSTTEFSISGAPPEPRS